MSVRSFYRALGVELPQRNVANVLVRCFAPGHEDRHPSCSVSTEHGVFNCKACGEKGGAYDAAIMLGRTPADAMRLLEEHGLVDGRGSSQEAPGAFPAADSPSGASPAFTVTDEDVARWHQELVTGSRRLTWLRELRGWTREALRELGLGWDGERVTIPVRDAAGVLTGVGRYIPDSASRPGSVKMLAVAGSRRELFPAPERMESGEGFVWLVEGEPDAVLATSLGFAAIALPGVACWRPEWAERFHGLRVVVCFDCDQPGRRAAERVARDLAGVAAEVRVLDLASDRDDSYDLTDFVLGRLGDDRTPEALASARKALLGLAEAAPVLSVYGSVHGPHAPEPAHTWQPFDLLALGAAQPKPPTISELVYPGKRHIVSGETEALKSWLALVLCAEQIRADNTVVYIDLEMGPRDTLARLRDLRISDKEITERFVYLEPREALTTELTPDLATLLRTRKATLVVLDAFDGALELHSLDPNSSREVERFYRCVIDTLRAAGAAVVILDHVAKDAEKRGRYAIGSQRKITAADVHLRLETSQSFGRGRHVTARIMVAKDRPGHLARPRAADLELTSDPATGQITWKLTPADPAVPPSFRPTCLMQRVSEFVETADRPPSRNHVEQGVKGNARAVRAAIGLLLEEGYLSVRDGPRNAQLLTSARPYREADDTVTSSTSSDLVPTSSETKSNATSSTSSTSSLDEGRGRGRGRGQNEDDLVLPLDEAGRCTAKPPSSEGFLTFARNAYRAGHLTRSEWLERVGFHGALIRATPGPRLEDELGALLAAGVLVEPEEPEDDDLGF